MKARAKTKLTYDASFQERIVRTLFQDPDWCVQFGVPNLDASLFENSVHRWVANATLSYAKRYSSGISRAALKIEARNAYTSGRLVRKRDRHVVDALLKKLPKPVRDRSYIKRELFRFIKTQTLKDVLLYDAVDVLKNNDVDRVDAILQRVLDVQAPTETGMGHFMARERVKRYDRRADWVPDGIATGLEVDSHMKAGGPRRKQLAAIVAPPHTGKTMTLCHLAKQAVMLANKRVLVITLEEDEETIQDRLDASFTGISINDLELDHKRRRVRKFWKRFEASHPHEMIVVKEFPMNVTTTAQIEAYIKSLERKGFYPDVVFVDYAGLMRPNIARRAGDVETRYEEIGSVFVDLRSMAQRLNILVWTALQGNRNSTGKRVVNMKDLAESFKPAMHADLLIAICQTEEEEKKRIARLYSMKVRGGRARMEFPVKLDYAKVVVVNRC